MQVLFNLPVTNNQNNNKYNNHKYPSFKINPKELKGIDHFVYKRFKINPQQFKTFEKFQEHCKTLAEEIKNRDFFGRQQETQLQRKAMINDWYNYLATNGAYTGAMILMILGGITSGLKPKEDTLPPVLNKGTLADTVDKIEKKAKENPNIESITFDKEYRLNLQNAIMSEETQLDENLNGWIMIPSKEHDPENFEANVDKLKMLSHNNWCTKSFNAEPYLSEGDFHVYMENGKPKLGVRFIGDEIQEIQSEKNNSKIPVRYGKIAEEHIKNYKLSEDTEDELYHLHETQETIKTIKAKYPNGINNAPVEKIFKEFGIKYKKDKDGLYIISHYGGGTSGYFEDPTRQDDDDQDDYDFCDLGIDEDRLFKYIKKIEGHANFSSSSVKDLGNLESIGGYVVIHGSNINNIGKLNKIGGEVYCPGKNLFKTLWQERLLSKIPENIQNASPEEIFKILEIKYKKNKDGLYTIDHYGAINKIYSVSEFGIDENKLFKHIKRIEGDADFSYSKLTDLGSLESIGENARFYNSEITSLGKLYSIGRNAYFIKSKITDLGNLRQIAGNAEFKHSQITNLGNLEIIFGDAEFKDSPITSLGKLNSIRGNANFKDSKIKNLGNLETIGGNACFTNSEITDLGNLNRICGKADFRNSKVISLGDLQTIDGSVSFANSQVTGLGNLERIGGNVDFRKSSVSNLGKLRHIEGCVAIKDSKLTPQDFIHVKIDNGRYKKSSLM